MIKWNKLKFMVQPGQRLSQRVLFAGLWIIISRVSARALGMVRIIILARILTPDDFGLVAIAVLVIEFVNQTTVSGFNTALVQRRDDIQSYLDTAWIMTVIRGVVLGIIVIVIAPVISSLYETPDATPFIQVMGLVLVFRAFTSAGLVYLIKELEMHKRFLLEISSSLAEMIVAIVLAYVLKSPWAIVLGAVTGATVFVIVSFIIHPYRPRLHLEISKARDLFSFGIWILLSAIIYYTITRLDSIIVGKLLGVVALGVYTLAYTICRPIADEVNNFAGRLVFPTLSILQDNKPSLRKASLTGLKAASQVTLPLAVIIFVVSEGFVPLILGEKWIDAVPVLRILGFATAVFSLQNIGGSVFWATGKPKLRFFIWLTTGVIMTGLLFPLTNQFGLEGAALAVLGGNIGGFILMIISQRRLLKLGILEIFKTFIPALIICLFLYGVLFLVNNAMNQAGIGEFIALVSSGLAAYVGISFIMWKRFKSGPVQIMNEFRRSN